MLEGSYEPIVRAVAAELCEEDIVTVPDCACQAANDTYHGGAKAEYYETFGDVALAYAWHRCVNTRYWGIHLKGLHVVHIHTTAIKSDCCECISRRALL